MTLGYLGVRQGAEDSGGTWTGIRKEQHWLLLHMCTWERNNDVWKLLEMRNTKQRSMLSQYHGSAAILNLCDSQTIWNVVDFKATEGTDFSVIWILCSTLYSLSPLCCFGPCPHPAYRGSACSLSLPVKREERGWRCLHSLCTFLFLFPPMDRDASPNSLWRSWIGAGFLCYNVHRGECDPVKLCPFRKTVQRERGHQSHHVW